MAITERYLDVELGTGANDGTSEADAWQTWADAVAGLTAGQRLNVKNPSSRFDVSGSAVFTTAGGSGAPVHIRGYDTTIGDGVAAQMENFRIQSSGDNMLIESLDILNSDASGQALIVMTGNNAQAYNSKLVTTQTTTTPRMIFIQTGGSVVNCYCEFGSTGVTNASQGVIDITNGVAYANIVRFTSMPGSGSPVAGIQILSPIEHAASAIRNLVYADRDVMAGVNVCGIACGDALATGDYGGYGVVNNTVDNFATGVYIYNRGGDGMVGTSAFVNNLITNTPQSFRAHSNGDAEVAMLVIVNNAYDGTVSGVVPIASRRITADPFTDPDNQDFSLNSTSGGGEVCRARGASTHGTLDIGAIAA